jgi:hypothetical protein
MCCACFSRAGIGPIVRSVGNFNSEQYVDFLENHVIPYAEETFPDSDFYILHDNSRIHTSYQTLAYLVLRFGANGVSVILRIARTVTLLRTYLGF